MLEPTVSNLLDAEPSHEMARDTHDGDQRYEQHVLDEGSTTLAATEVGAARSWQPTC